VTAFGGFIPEHTFATTASAWKAEAGRNEAHSRAQTRRGDGGQREIAHCYPTLASLGDPFLLLESVHPSIAG
jgi:hypothetical protein